MEIGSTIKTIRKKKGIGQVELAANCNISQTYLSQIENNQRNPTIGVLENICNNMDVPFAVVNFLSLSEKDISLDKQERFKIVKPIIEKLIEGVFV